MAAHDRGRPRQVLLYICYDKFTGAVGEMNTIYKCRLQNANYIFRPMQLLNNIFDYNHGYNACVIYCDLFLKVAIHLRVFLRKFSVWQFQSCGHRLDRNCLRVSGNCRESSSRQFFLTWIWP